MDDFSVSSLTESQNEWCSRLVSILTPLIIGGFRSIFDEAWKLCSENKEESKYLMTFQNFIARITKWNPTMIQEETNRIKESSGCGYLEELVTCVHIIKLKALTCARAGQKQKKVSVNIPQLEDFIHKIYINSARKIYTNVYLFDKTSPPLQIQKHNRELEIIIKESILLTIRDSIPVEGLLRAYLDETQETDVEVEEKEEIIENVIQPQELPPSSENHRYQQGGDDNLNKNNDESSSASSSNNAIRFNDTDFAINTKGQEETIEAPKTIERLEQISEANFIKRNQEEDDDDDGDKLTIGTDINLDDIDVFDLRKNKVLEDPLLLDIETLS